MENFQENFRKIENNEKLEPFLNNWDKEYLEKGVIGMFKKIYNDFNNNFPDVILLPERGARPLYYLLNPIFRKINIEKNTTIPKFVYFSVGQKAGVNLQICEQYDDIKTSNDLKTSMVQINPGLSESTIDKLVDIEKVEDVMLSRGKMKERADEILEEILEKKLQVVIIDEVLSNGATIEEIRKSFKNDELPAYTIVALQYSAGIANAGYTFNEEYDNKNPNPQINGYSFSFENAEDAIGIKKTPYEKYSLPIRKDGHIEIEKLVQNKKQLRSEMKNLGEEIAKKIDLIDIS
jgi:hypothetical protein